MIAHFITLTMDEQQLLRWSKLIREVRGDKSLRKISRELKVSPVAVSSWEHGDSIPTVESLEKVARLKGWDIYQLLRYLRNEEPAPSIDEAIKLAMQLPTYEKLRLATLLLTSEDVQTQTAQLQSLASSASNVSPAASSSMAVNSKPS